MPRTAPAMYSVHTTFLSCHCGGAADMVLPMGVAAPAHTHHHMLSPFQWPSQDHFHLHGHKQIKGNRDCIKPI